MSSPTTRVFAPVCALLALAASPLFAQGDLTGYWLDEHGGQYILRQVGSRVFWSSATLPRVANVFVGTISGNMIVGEWADLPSGELRGSGVLSLRIDSNDRLVKTGESAPYGSSVWTRSGAPAPPVAGAGPVAGEWVQDIGPLREVWTIRNAGGRWAVVGRYFRAGQQVGALESEARFENGHLYFHQRFTPKPDPSWADTNDGDAWLEGERLMVRHRYGQTSLARAR